MKSRRTFVGGGYEIRYLPIGDRFVVRATYAPIFLWGLIPYRPSRYFSSEEFEQLNEEFDIVLWTRKMLAGTINDVTDRQIREEAERQQLDNSEIIGLIAEACSYRKLLETIKLN